MYIVHVGNPPDLLFLLALRPGGTRFVFDHHDLVPNCSLCFPGGKRILRRLTGCAERLTFAAADGAISTNESSRRVAIERGKNVRPPGGRSRSAPDHSRFHPAGAGHEPCVAANPICSHTWA